MLVEGCVVACKLLVFEVCCRCRASRIACCLLCLACRELFPMRCCGCLRLLCVMCWLAFSVVVRCGLFIELCLSFVDIC